MAPARDPRGRFFLARSAEALMPQTLPIRVPPRKRISAGLSPQRMYTAFSRAVCMGPFLGLCVGRVDSSGAAPGGTALYQEVVGRTCGTTAAVCRGRLVGQEGLKQVWCVDGRSVPLPCGRHDHACGLVGRSRFRAGSRRDSICALEISSVAANERRRPGEDLIRYHVANAVCGGGRRRYGMVNLKRKGGDE